MKITRISVYQADLPLKEGFYSWNTQSFTAFDTTVVAIETDEGITGYGETCPLGPSYLPAYPQGARTGIATMAPELIGWDPSALDVINARMDRVMKGHPYAKSAIDLACWDILGKATGQPVCHLLGGQAQEKVKLFKVVTVDAPENMATRLQEYQAAGFTQFQVKVGHEREADIARMRACAAVMRRGDVMDADANTGWRQHDALRIAKAMERIQDDHPEIGVYLEQPCISYEECLAVRRATTLPMVLDEVMTGPDAVIRGATDRAMDLINLKINRVGGLTRARLIRDLCLHFGIVMTIEDSWGGEISTSAIAHLAASTPATHHWQSSAFQDYHDVCIASGGAVVEGGWMRPSAMPGLGIEPDFAVLGDPVFQTV
ncbi:mandelate racemase/muconate lactonizing enzyme family protein [Rhodobacteraceae bacterium NNCM2]|nr:mandelate racemase/muconate lactonizing enzyme family protein [Coraliihabitans acroporae]